MIKLAVEDIILKHSDFLISLRPEVTEKDMMPRSCEEGLLLSLLLTLLFKKYTYFLRISQTVQVLGRSSCSKQEKIHDTPFLLHFWNKDFTFIFKKSRLKKAYFLNIFSCFW